MEQITLRTRFPSQIRDPEPIDTEGMSDHEISTERDTVTTEGAVNPDESTVFWTNFSRPDNARYTIENMPRAPCYQAIAATTTRDNLPPRNHILEDLEVGRLCQMRDEGDISTMELARNWPQTFTLEGSIRAERIPFGRPCLVQGQRPSNFKSQSQPAWFYGLECDSYLLLGGGKLRQLHPDFRPGSGTTPWILEDSSRLIRTGSGNTTDKRLSASDIIFEPRTDMEITDMPWEIDVRRCTLGFIKAIAERRTDEHCAKVDKYIEDICDMLPENAYDDVNKVDGAVLPTWPGADSYDIIDGNPLQLSFELIEARSTKQSDKQVWARPRASEESANSTGIHETIAPITQLTTTTKMLFNQNHTAKSASRTPTAVTKTQDGAMDFAPAGTSEKSAGKRRVVNPTPTPHPSELVSRRAGSEQNDGPTEKGVIASSPKKRIPCARCGYENHAWRSRCIYCDHPGPRAIQPGKVTCVICTYQNHPTATNCFMCEAVQVQDTDIKIPDIYNHTWACPHCDQLTPNPKQYCLECESLRPGTRIPAEPATKPDTRPGPIPRTSTPSTASPKDSKEACKPIQKRKPAAEAQESHTQKQVRLSREANDEPVVSSLSKAPATSMPQPDRGASRTETAPAPLRRKKLSIRPSPPDQGH